MRLLLVLSFVGGSTLTHSLGVDRALGVRSWQRVWASSSRIERRTTLKVDTESFAARSSVALRGTLRGVVYVRAKHYHDQPCVFACNSSPEGSTRIEPYSVLLAGSSLVVEGSAVLLARRSK